MTCQKSQRRRLNMETVSVQVEQLYKRVLELKGKPGTGRGVGPRVALAPLISRTFCKGPGDDDLIWNLPVLLHSCADSECDM